MSKEHLIEIKIIQAGRVTGQYSPVDSKSLRLEKIIYPEENLPFDVGILPTALSPFNEPFPVLVLGNVSHPPHTEIEARLLGAVQRGEETPILLSIPNTDERAPQYLENLAANQRAEIINTLNVSKPGKWHWLSLEEIEPYLHDATLRYRQSQVYGKPAHLDPAWKPIHVGRPAPSFAEAERYTAAEYTFYELPHHFQRYVSEYLAPDERILCAARHRATDDVVGAKERSLFPSAGRARAGLVEGEAFCFGVGKTPIGREPALRLARGGGRGVGTDRRRGVPSGVGAGNEEPASQCGGGIHPSAESTSSGRTGYPVMTFHSILFDKDDLQKETAAQPAFFADLNLDQVIEAITARREEYNLKPFFYMPLRDVETIYYRHEVTRDMENEMLMAHIKAFAEKMIIVRRYLALVEKLDFNYHKKGWFLEAALVYCEAVTDLARDLSLADLRSRGFLAFHEYMTNYANSHGFQSLLAEAHKVKGGLSGMKYSVIIQNGGTVKVRRYEGETDYSVEVEKTFEKFKQGAVKDYRVDLYKGSGMNHIEAQILDSVARLYPKRFAALDQFCASHNQFVDEAIRVFDREIQFYIAYLELAADIKRKGLTFCYPQVGASREVYDQDGFDLALAHSLLYTEKPVICNEFFLKGPERIIVVSGPNQGGKTTFARTFGQLHYLASLGCPVPGREARLFLFDQIFTHFEKEENIKNLRGKLQDDLTRIHDILALATPDSILILNEIFASTTLQDAVFLSKKIMARVMELDSLCVWVTFMDELSSLSEKTVSMVSTVVPKNPAMRTFKVIRKPADGLAYAISLAEKHRLTYEQIKERIQS